MTELPAAAPTSSGSLSETNENAPRVLRPQDVDYSNHLMSCEQKAQTDFDRTVMALSGGALAISFAFIEKIVGAVRTDMGLIAFGWGAWVASMSSVLLSHYFSALAMRYTLVRFDQDSLKGRTSSPYDWWILVLNALGGMLFIAGAIAAGVFVIRNLNR